MSPPDPEAVLRALTDVIALGHNVGLPDVVRPLEPFDAELRAPEPTVKGLRGRLDPLIQTAYIAIRAHVLEDDLFNPRPGMEKNAAEMKRAFGAMTDALYPLEPQMPEMDISGFAGSEHVKEKTIGFEGDPSGVKPVVERSIELIRRYSQVLGSGDFEAAYALTDSGLREWMSYKRFVGEHEKAARRYGGPALEFHIDRFNYVYADDTARKKSNTSVEGWPKGTPKENRRGAVGGFWVRDRATQSGCGGTLWIAEEEGEYRIAGFSFRRP
jgi:hypothetical protein